jgi:hypothetical protein
MLKRHAE